jgi:hypothetical protein
MFLKSGGEKVNENRVVAPTGFERLCTLDFRGITPSR